MMVRSLLPLLGATLMSLALATASAADDSDPVVLQLFTSQGCSSCPPADRLLSRLGSSAELRGKVIPLAFHVDYWNHIGWVDPFSQAAWSARQEAYAQAVHSDRIYTPQLLVNGETDCNGADERCVERAIRRALDHAPRWRLALALAPAGDARTGASRVSAKLALEPVGTPAPTWPRLWVAVTESGFETAVGKGENAHQKLANDFVVRRLVPVAIDPASGAGEALVDLDPTWDTAHLQITAFAEDPRSLKIVAAALGRTAAAEIAIPAQ